MSKRAETAAIKAYPFLPTNVNNDVWDDNKEPRAIYQQGYEQAEKDTIERAVEYIKATKIFGRCFPEDFRKAMEEE